MNDNSIEVRKFNPNGGFVFELRHSYGFLMMSYIETHKIATIDDIYVEPSRLRNGIGSLLLRKSIEVAKEVEAERITAILVSRSGILTCQSVFGDESVRVSHVGVGDQTPLGHLTYTLPVNQ